jgi:ATP-binding cassette subfamily B protein
MTKNEQTKNTSSKEQRKVLWRLLSYGIPYKKSLVIAFILLIFGTIGELLGPYLIKVFIDDYLVKQYFPYEPILYLALIYIVVHVSKVFIQYFQLYLFQKIALKIIQQLRIDVFAKVQRLGLKYFDKTPGGSIVSRVTNDTEAIKELFTSVLSVFVQNIFFLVGIFIAMFILNVKLAFFCLAIIPIIYIIMKAYRKYSSVYYHDMREKLSQLNAKLNESLQGMAVIQVFRQEKRLRY